VIRRIEARIGRVGLTILLFFVATLTVCVPVGVLGSSNLVWGEDNQYGRVDIPGSEVLHLPGHTVDVNLAVALPGRGNETPDLLIPKGLSLSVVPVDGGGRPVVIRQDIGGSENANDDHVDTQRRVWKIDVPSDGAYHVTARGNLLGFGVNPQLWLGHGPPIPGPFVPLIAAIIVLVGGSFWFLVLPRLRGRGRSADSDPPDPGTWDSGLPPPDPAPQMHRTSSPDSVGKLAELAALHERGALTDDEFAAEKAKVISRD
jgi:Short C-terminal domain